MEKEKVNKVNKGLIVINIILLLALLGTSFYIVYDKVLRKDEVITTKSNNTDQVVDSKVEIPEVELNTIISQITDVSTYLADCYPFFATEPLDNQKALYFGLSMLDVMGDDFMESDLEKVWDEYFGVDHPYIHQDIMCEMDGEVLYSYDSARREYFYQDIHGHGGSARFQPYVYFVDGEVVQEKEYLVDVNILYASNNYGTSGPRTAYYTEVEEQDENTMILGPYDGDHDITEEEYVSVQEELPVLRFRFLKDDDGNYGLVEVKLQSE